MHDTLQGAGVGCVVNPLSGTHESFARLPAKLGFNYDRAISGKSFVIFQACTYKVYWKKFVNIKLKISFLTAEHSV